MRWSLAGEGARGLEADAVTWRRIGRCSVAANSQFRRTPLGKPNISVIVMPAAAGHFDQYSGHVFLHV